MCRKENVAEEMSERVVSAILFLNSNKSEHNLRKKIAELRVHCRKYAVEIGNDVIVNKGPDRDIDREAINKLITQLLSGKYDVVAVEHMLELTDDISDLEEFVHDAARIGVAFVDLSDMTFYGRLGSEEESKVRCLNWNGGADL